MSQYILDTDHLTHYERGHQPLLQKLAALVGGAWGVSAVTVEEALRGRLAYLSRHLTSAARVRGYSLLIDTVRMLERILVVPFDQASEALFQQLRSQGMRIGSRDLRIAAVALVNRSTLLTRNSRDFSQVPGLVFEDWSV